MPNKSLFYCLVNRCKVSWSNPFLAASYLYLLGILIPIKMSFKELNRHEIVEQCFLTKQSLKKTFLLNSSSWFLSPIRVRIQPRWHCKILQISIKSFELFIFRVKMCTSDCLSTDASDECGGDCTLLSVKLDDKSSVKDVRQVSFGGLIMFCCVKYY